MVFAYYVNVYGTIQNGSFFLITEQKEKYCSKKLCARVETVDVLDWVLALNGIS